MVHDITTMFTHAIPLHHCHPLFDKVIHCDMINVIFDGVFSLQIAFLGKADVLVLFKAHNRKEQYIVRSILNSNIHPKLSF